MNKICFIVGNRAHYARVRPIIKHLPTSAFRIVLVESAAINEYGNIRAEIEKDYSCDNVTTLFTNVAGSNLVSMTKSTGLVISELATELSTNRPDVLVVIADRYEALGASVAARYLNIPLAHIQGGENTGSIDDSIRHSITKLANLHFVSNQECADRIIKMGEPKDRVFVTGCPTMDICRSITEKNLQEIFDSYNGVYENKFVIEKKFLLVAFHPVTTEYKDNQKNFNIVLDAINETNLQSIWLYPNIDAGGDLIRKEILNFKSVNTTGKIHFFKHFPVEDYLLLLKHASCFVGNSSVGIRETSFFGTPSVNIGSRQRGRTRSQNVLDCNVSKIDIIDCINQQLDHGGYEPSYMYGDGKAGERIASILMDSTVDINKVMSY